MNPYIDPVLKRYADLITASTPAFKRVYFGDPLRIATSEMPVLILQKLDTRFGKLTSAEDQHEMRISITVVADSRDSLSEDKLLVAGFGTLYDLMEGRDENYQLKPQSLLYILRHNIDLDTARNLRTDLGSVTRVDYGTTVGKRGQDMWSIEGVIEITSVFSQLR